MPNHHTLPCQDEALTLLPERAIWWKRRRLLLVADLHLGKAASFRAAGIPLPEGADSDDLQRLSNIIERTRASGLVILGDVIHNRASLSERMLEAFAHWRNRHPALQVRLAIGNHDRPISAIRESLALDACQERFVCEPFVLQHAPEPSADGYVLAGHTHPRVAISDKQSPRLSLPCFHFSDQVGTLPAFGSLTGTYKVRPDRRDRVVVVGDGILAEVPPALCC